jgi:maleate isomerase
MDDLRPAGVTNHIERLHVSNVKFRGPEDAYQIVQEGLNALEPALDRLLSCNPDRLIMAMAVPCFWDAHEGCARVRQRIEASTSLPFILPPEALSLALRQWPGIKKIGVLTPYIPAADEHVKRYFEEDGYETVIIGLRAATEDSVINITPEQLRDGFLQLADEGVDAFVHVGTSIALARLVEMFEFWLGKPVLSVNIATYWASLRSAGIADRIEGHGQLLKAF